MVSDRINTRLPEALAGHVARMVEKRGYYETPSEYIRDLIRKDMDKHNAHYIKSAILEGTEDIETGRYFESTGDFKKDMQIFKEKEQNGWI